MARGSGDEPVRRMRCKRYRDQIQTVTRLVTSASPGCDPMVSCCHGPVVPTRRAFSLIEILIVVVILGILAVLVVPYYVNMNQNARASRVLTELQTIRKQLQVYQAEHNGEYPALIEMWDNLTTRTDDQHNPGGDFGPYLTAAPLNPWTAGSMCAADNSADWQYDEATGDIRAVMSADVIARMELSSDDVIASP